MTADKLDEFLRAVCLNDNTALFIETVADNPKISILTDARLLLSQGETSRACLKVER